MPELPEVETVACALRDGGRGAESILGEVIIGGTLDWAKTLEFPDETTFWKRINHRKIENVFRRGKFLCIQLDQGTLIFHFRMSGDLLVVDANCEFPDHIRLDLHFESSRRLGFRNVRKFGRVWLVDDPEIVLGNLGPEPFDPELEIVFYDLLQKRNRQIKPLLMDQSFIAGVGNIYADESLHLAKIHPQTIASRINRKQSQTLLEAIKTVLGEAIARNGTSIDWMYAGGDYQEQLRVYQRDGSSCLLCGTEISRIIVAQRGTHYCPECQIKNI